MCTLTHDDQDSFDMPSRVFVRVSRHLWNTGAHHPSVGWHTYVPWLPPSLLMTIYQTLEKVTNGVSIHLLLFCGHPLHLLVLLL